MPLNNVQISITIEILIALVVSIVVQQIRKSENDSGRSGKRLAIKLKTAFEVYWKWWIGKKRYFSGRVPNEKRGNRQQSKWEPTQFFDLYKMLVISYVSSFLCFGKRQNELLFHLNYITDKDHLYAQFFRRWKTLGYNRLQRK